MYIYILMNMAELNQKRAVHPGLFYLLDILVGDVVRLNGGQWSEHGEVSRYKKKGTRSCKLYGLEWEQFKNGESMDFHRG